MMLVKEQLKNLGNSNMICDIYGNQPVMVSAQCMQKNTKQCNSNDASILMKDRKQVGYDVQCVCRYCYNLMFNNVLYHLFEEENTPEWTEYLNEYLKVKIKN